MKSFRKIFWGNFRFLKKLAIVVAVAFFAFAFVWQRAYTLSLSHRVSESKSTLRKWQCLNAEKAKILAQLQSPTRIEELNTLFGTLQYSTPQSRVLVYEKINPPKPESHFAQSYAAIKELIVENAGIFALSRRQAWKLEYGNL